MEDFIGLIFTVLIIFGSSLLRGRREQKGGTAPPQKRTFMDFGRELVKQIEALDQNSPAPKTIPKVEVRPTYVPSIQEAEAEIEVESIQSYIDSINREEHRTPAPSIKRPVIADTAPLKVERTASKELPIKNRLTPRELKQSIVMAEVLGPPRARRPHALVKHQ